jgi:hypothetical protein
MVLQAVVCEHYVYVTSQQPQRRHAVLPHGDRAAGSGRKPRRFIAH